mgnify:FL=1
MFTPWRKKKGAQMSRLMLAPSSFLVTRQKMRISRELSAPEKIQGMLLRPAASRLPVVTRSRDKLAYADLTSPEAGDDLDLPNVSPSQIPRDQDRARNVRAHVRPVGKKVPPGSIGKFSHRNLGRRAVKLSEADAPVAGVIGDEAAKIAHEPSAQQRIRLNKVDSLPSQGKSAPENPGAHEGDQSASPALTPGAVGRVRGNLPPAFLSESVNPEQPPAAQPTPRLPAGEVITPILSSRRKLPTRDRLEYRERRDSGLDTATTAPQIARATDSSAENRDQQGPVRADDPGVVSGPNVVDNDSSLLVKHNSAGVSELRSVGAETSISGPMPATPATPASQTPATPASQTPATPASQTPATPASQTPATPASQTPATPTLDSGLVHRDSDLVVDGDSGGMNFSPGGAENRDQQGRVRADDPGVVSGPNVVDNDSSLLVKHNSAGVSELRSVGAETSISGPMPSTPATPASRAPATPASQTPATPASPILATLVATGPTAPTLDSGGLNFSPGGAANVAAGSEGASFKGFSVLQRRALRRSGTGFVAQEDAESVAVQGKGVKADPDVHASYDERSDSDSTTRVVTSASHTLPKNVVNAVAKSAGSSPDSVEVLRGPAVDSRAKSISAEAYTENGQVHIPGKASLDSRANQVLLAHEVTHLVQQRAGALPLEHTSGGQQLEAQALQAETHVTGARVTQPGSLRSSEQPRVPAKSYVPRAILHHGQSQSPQPADSEPVSKWRGSNGSAVFGVAGLAKLTSPQKPSQAGTTSMGREGTHPDQAPVVSTGAIHVPLEHRVVTQSRPQNQYNDSLSQELSATRSGSGDAARRETGGISVSGSSSGRGVLQRRAANTPAPVVDRAPTEPNPPRVKKLSPAQARDSVRVESSASATDAEWLDRHSRALYPLIRDLLRADLLRDRERRSKMMREY